MDYYNTSIKPIIEFKITVICDTVALLIYIKNWLFLQEKPEYNIHIYILD